MVDWVAWQPSLKHAMCMCMSFSCVFCFVDTTSAPCLQRFRSQTVTNPISCVPPATNAHVATLPLLWCLQQNTVLMRVMNVCMSRGLKSDAMAR